MTRKDYERLASALAVATGEARDNADVLNGVRKAAVHIATVLGAENPRFDRRRFLMAVGFADGIAATGGAK